MILQTSKYFAVFQHLSRSKIQFFGMFPTMCLHYIQSNVLQISHAQKMIQVEVNGNNAAPLYKFLKAEKGGLLIDAIKWNFTKFLVNKEGKVMGRYAPSTSPLKIEVVHPIQDMYYVVPIERTWFLIIYIVSCSQEDIQKLLQSS